MFPLKRQKEIKQTLRPAGYLPLEPDLNLLVLGGLITAVD